MDSDQDWLAVLTPGDPNAAYPPGVGAGGDASIMIPKSENVVTFDLDGFISDAPGGTPAGTGKATAKWTKTSGPGEATFADASNPKTKVTLDAAGEYVLTLLAKDQKQSASSSVTVNVNPFTPHVKRSLSAMDDACIDGNKVINNKFLKLKGQEQTSILKFDLINLPPRIVDARLRLTVLGDGGSGTLKLFAGSHTHWRGARMRKSSAPKPNGLIGSLDVDVAEGDIVEIDANKLLKGPGLHSLVLTLEEGGDDIWFGSLESAVGPKLVLTFDDPDGSFSSFGEKVEDLPPAKKKGEVEKVGVKKKFNSTVDGDQIILNAMQDFQFAVEGDFVLGYKDKRQRALAINAAKHKDKFAAAEAQFQGAAGSYDLVLSSLSETDGESSYRLFVAGRKVGEAQNPETDVDYALVKNRFKQVALKPGDTIRVEFNSASNGKIPEGDGFAFSRGRWQSVAIVKPASQQE